MLSEFRDYCLATYRERKPMVMDEDNCASLYRDEVGWTIHRKARLDGFAERLAL